MVFELVDSELFKQRVSREPSLESEPTPLNFNSTYGLLLLFDVFGSTSYELLVEGDHHLFSLHFKGPHQLDLFCSTQFEGILFPQALLITDEVPFVQQKKFVLLVLSLLLDSSVEQLRHLDVGDLFQVL